jgi:hypothetical protein
VPSCIGANEYSSEETMSIKVSNLEVIQRLVGARVNAMGKVFKKSIEVEKDNIIKRTHRGVDMNGEAFEAYSPKNPGKNWKAHRERKNRQTAYVDLKFSEDMFKAFKAVVERSGFKFLATIFFDDRKQAQKAKGHHTGRLGPTTFEPRKFFGLSQSQREAIISKIRNAK